MNSSLIVLFISFTFSLNTFAMIRDSKDKEGHKVFKIDEKEYKESFLSKICWGSGCNSTKKPTVVNILKKIKESHQIRIDFSCFNNYETFLSTSWPTHPSYPTDLTNVTNLWFHCPICLEKVLSDTCFRVHSGSLISAINASTLASIIRFQFIEHLLDHHGASTEDIKKFLLGDTTFVLPAELVEKQK